MDKYFNFKSLFTSCTAPLHPCTLKTLVILSYFSTSLNLLIRHTGTAYNTLFKDAQTLTPTGFIQAETMLFVL